MADRYVGRIDLGEGKYYEGELLNGQRDGKGTYHFPGGIFVGEYKNGKRNGPGSLIYDIKDSDSYEFDNRQYELREKYIGNWVDGKLEGRVVHYYGGVPYDLKYENSKVVEDSIYNDLEPGMPLTDQDTVKCYYGGQSSFVIETVDETLIFDWYRSSVPPLNPDKPVYIFISHVHLDHFNDRIGAIKEKYDVRGIYIGYDWSCEESEGAIDDILKSCEDLVSCFRGEQYLITDFGSIKSLRSTDLGVAYVVKTASKTFFHAGDLFCRSGMTFNSFRKMNEHIAEAVLKTAFEKAVGSNEKTFMEYTKPLAEMGRIDYAMLPLDPRWYDYGIRTVNHYLDVADIRFFSPMHLWEQWDYVSDFVKTNPRAAEKMISVNPDGISIFKSIEINKPYYVRLQ